ncbi:MAG: zinc protease, partial [Arthrobacter sp.]|nr:zinc protease [Arthrobacter sp.]
VCELVVDALHSAGWSLAPDAAPVERRSTERAEITGTAGLHVVKRPVEQANIIMGCPTIVATDDRRFVMSVLNAVLGGGMSSRLFQEVREKRGLVYSTYSFASSYADAGYFGMYAGCTPSKVRQVLELLGAELDKLAEGGISDDELRKAEGQLCGGIVLALEDTGSRMSRLGRAELVSGEYQDIDETLRQIKAVTAADVQELARELAAAPRTITVVGPFEETETFGL